VQADGYHALAFAVEPACPPAALIPDGLACVGVRLTEPVLDAYTPAPVPDDFPVGLRAPDERGISIALRSAYAPEMLATGDALTVYLDWAFETPRDEYEVRFVHVLDAAGTLVAQSDVPLAAPGTRLAAGERRTEIVTLPTETLPPGTYRLYAGWYTFPDIASFCRLANDACAGTEVLLGEVVIAE
jgi:hypothetical protein